MGKLPRLRIVPGAIREALLSQGDTLRVFSAFRRPSPSLSRQRWLMVDDLSLSLSLLRSACITSGRMVRGCITEALGRGSFRRVGVVRCAWRPDSLRVSTRACEESSAPRASFACTRDALTHVVLLCPVSHVNLRPRAAEGRDRERRRGAKQQRTNSTERRRRQELREWLMLNRRIGGVLHGLKCPFLG